MRKISGALTRAIRKHIIKIRREQMDKGNSNSTVNDKMAENREGFNF